MTRYVNLRWQALLLVAALLGTLCTACFAADGDEAISLYKEGRYAEARPQLEALDAKGKAGGALLYRLAFCQRTTGDATAAAATEQRALKLLEEEVGSTREIEVPFYLVNTYQNLGREPDAQRVAAAAVARFDKGEFAKPKSGDGMFQIGKLYADHGAESKAVEWYELAVEALVRDDDRGSYLQRASRYLGERAWRDQDAEKASVYYGHLIRSGAGDAPELERLAVVQTRARQYAEAAESWKQIPDRFGPVNTDRANYFGRLTAMASKLGNLPGSSADGREWSELSKGELEELMKAEAALVRQLMVDAGADEEWSREKRKQGQSRIAEHKAVLVAAALEYGLRGNSIREAAFFGGFAPLLLNESAWRLPRVTDDEGNTLGRKNRKGKKSRRTVARAGRRVRRASAA